jgi:hypothetical protein
MEYRDLIDNGTIIDEFQNSLFDDLDDLDMSDADTCYTLSNQDHWEDL